MKIILYIYVSRFVCAMSKNYKFSHDRDCTRRRVYIQILIYFLRFVNFILLLLTQKFKCNSVLFFSILLQEVKIYVHEARSSSARTYIASCILLLLYSRVIQLDAALSRRY